MLKYFCLFDHIASTSLDGQPIRLDNEDIDDNLMGLDIGRKDYRKI